MPRHIRQIIHCLRKLVKSVEGVDRSWNRKSPGPDGARTVKAVMRDRASLGRNTVPALRRCLVKDEQVEELVINATQ